MQRSTLLVGVGAALGGIAVTLGLLAVVYQPLLFFVALPFAGVGYLMWYQGTGRLAARMRRRAERERFRREARRRAQRSGGDGDGHGHGHGDGDPRWADPEFGERRRRARERAGGPFRGGAGGPFRGGTGPGDSRRRRTPPRGGTDGMSVEEAYRTLGISPGSSPDEVRDAYRSKVKDVHPDTQDGDGEAFKEVNEAYETLQERVL